MWRKTNIKLGFIEMSKIILELRYAVTLHYTRRILKCITNENSLKRQMSWEWLRFRQISQKTDLLDSLRSSKKLNIISHCLTSKSSPPRCSSFAAACVYTLHGGHGLDWALCLLRLPAGEVLTVLDIRGLGYGYKVSEQKSVSNDECLSQADIHGDVWNRIISDYRWEIKWEDRTDDCYTGFIFMSNTLSIFPLFGI